MFEDPINIGKPKGRWTSSRRKFTVTYSLSFSEIAVILSVMMALVLLLVPAILAARERLPKTATTAIPDRPPDFGHHRVCHPSGFSIVRPEFWHFQIAWEQDNVNEGSIRLSSPPGFEPVTYLTTAKLAEEPHLQGRITGIEFQGKPARMGRELQKTNSGGNRLTLEIAFYRDGSWWSVHCDHFGEASLPGPVWDYINTFSTNLGGGVGFIDSLH